MTPIPHSRMIILARHGSTDLNDNGDKIRGWRDVPLNDHGKRQAEELGNRLKKEKFDIIISSDLKRAVQTAEAISRHTGKAIVKKTIGLRPWDLGEFTGIESKIVIPQLGKFIDNPNRKIPQGESFNEFKTRCLDEIKGDLEAFKHQVILFVAHHRNDRLLDAWIHGGRDGIDLNKFKQKGCEPADYQHYKIYTS